MAAVEMFPWIAHYSGVMICLNSKKNNNNGNPFISQQK